MDNVITIIGSKENELEFDLTIQGLNEQPSHVCFVIETSQVNFSFKSIKSEEGKWSVKIPPLPQIENTAYPYHIEVVIDGYFFEPIRGIVNVSKSAEVYSTAPKQPIITSPEVKPEVKSEIISPRPVVEKKLPTTKTVEEKIIKNLEINNLVKKIVESEEIDKKKAITNKKKTSKKKPVVKKVTKDKKDNVDSEVNKKVKNILEGISTTNKIISTPEKIINFKKKEIVNR